MPIFICSFNKDYEIFLSKLYTYVTTNYAKSFNLSSLHKIELVPSISNNSDGRMINTSYIILSKRLYDLLPSLDIDSLRYNTHFKSIVAVLYHELCHINEYTIMPNLHSICQGKINIDLFVALLWIEYVVESRTNAILSNDKGSFFDDIALNDWNIAKYNYYDNDTSNYYYLVKVLPYVLAINKRKDFFRYVCRFKNEMVKQMILELLKSVQNLEKLYPFDDIETLEEIKSIILSYQKSFKQQK